MKIKLKAKALEAGKLYHIGDIADDMSRNVYGHLCVKRLNNLKFKQKKLCFKEVAELVLGVDTKSGCKHEWSIEISHKLMSITWNKPSGTGGIASTGMIIEKMIKKGSNRSGKDSKERDIYHTIQGGVANEEDYV